MADFGAMFTTMGGFSPSGGGGGGGSGRGGQGQGKGEGPDKDDERSGDDECDEQAASPGNDV